MTDEQFRLLSYYRDEVKHEYNLLAMRSTILVTCQSFLVVAFAILNTASNFPRAAILAAAIALLGAYTAWTIREPILAAHRSIGNWLQKQRQLLGTIEFGDYKSDRDRIPGVEADATKDSDYEKSVAFSKHAPIAFLLFWAVGIGWIAVRLAQGD